MLFVNSEWQAEHISERDPEIMDDDKAPMDQKKKRLLSWANGEK